MHMDWYDFELPKDEFVKGVNEIVFAQRRATRTTTTCIWASTRAKSAATAPSRLMDRRG